jgi:hypothetical protein
MKGTRIALALILFTTLTASACWSSRMSARHPGDQLGDPCHLDDECDSNFCAAHRCEVRDP